MPPNKARYAITKKARSNPGLLLFVSMDHYGGMVTILFIHSAGSQGPGEGSSALLTGLRAILPPRVALVAPLMPKPDAPEAEPWLMALDAEMRAIEGDFLMLGHSLGGSVILQTLARFGVPDRLLGVVTLAAPFWGAGGWEVEDFALPHDASTRLRALPRLVILQGDADEVVEKNHPNLYQTLLPQALVTVLPGIDHEASLAAPAVLDALKSITPL